MENCVDIKPFNSRQVVVIKEPGSARHPNGDAIKKIECSLEEGRELIEQLQQKLGGDL